MKKYRKLKARLIERGWSQQTVASVLGRSLSYVVKCMNKKNGGFNNEEILTLMQRLDIPDDEFAHFFGRAEREGF